MRDSFSLSRIVTSGVQAPQAGVLTYLEHFSEPGAGSHRILLERFPFRIGRSETANWVLRTPKISRDHAEIFVVKGSAPGAGDLRSPNGAWTRAPSTAPIVPGRRRAARVNRASPTT